MYSIRRSEWNLFIGFAGQTDEAEKDDGNHNCQKGNCRIHVEANADGSDDHKEDRTGTQDGTDEHDELICDVPEYNLQVTT